MGRRSSASGPGGWSSSRSAERVESRDCKGEKALAAAVAAPDDDMLSPPWLQRGGVAVVDDDEASSEEAANTSEEAFTAANRSPPPLPSSQKSRMCAAMGLDMPSCKEKPTPRQNLLFQTKLLYL
jgi:hypothetical protein